MTKKIAIVTGGASGIGLAVTKELMKQDYQVVVADINQEALEDYSQKYPLYDGKKVDVTDEKEVIDFVNYVIKEYGQIDASFHIAGAMKQGIIVDQSYEDWKFTVDLCLNAVFLFTKYVGQQMRKQNRGKIVNISSLNAHVPMFFGGAYSTAKAGVEMLTKNTALELADYNVNVNAILPGLVATPMAKSTIENVEINKRYEERIPFRRAADPAEIAKPAVFLASDAASYINGTSLVVDGGWEISGYPDLRM